VWQGDGDTLSGTIWPQSGTFSAISVGCAGGCSFTANDQLDGVVGSTRLDFTSAVSSGVHGFDFIVDASTTVYFHMMLNQQAAPETVLFTSSGQMSSASTDPFGLVAQ
jgi:hypothetical protein